MSLHGLHKPTIRNHHVIRADGNREGDIERVIRRVIDRETNIECDVVQSKIRGGRWFDLSTKQTKRLARFVRCEHSPADLQP